MARSADFRKKYKAKEALRRLIAQETEKMRQAKRKGDATQEGVSRNLIEKQLKPKLAAAEREYFAAIREAVGEEAIRDRLKGIPGNVARGAIGKVKGAVGKLNVMNYIDRQPTIADIKAEAKSYTRIVDQETQRYRKDGTNRNGVQYAGRCGMCNLNGARHSPTCRIPSLRNASFNSEDRA